MLCHENLSPESSIHNIEDPNMGFGQSKQSVQFGDKNQVQTTSNSLPHYDEYLIEAPEEDFDAKNGGTQQLDAIANKFDDYDEHLSLNRDLESTTSGLGQGHLDVPIVYAKKSVDPNGIIERLIHRRSHEPHRVEEGYTSELTMLKTRGFTAVGAWQLFQSLLDEAQRLDWTQGKFINMLDRLSSPEYRNEYLLRRGQWMNGVLKKQGTQLLREQGKKLWVRGFDNEFLELYCVELEKMFPGMEKDPDAALLIMHHDLESNIKDVREWLFRWAPALQKIWQQRLPHNFERSDSGPASLTFADIYSTITEAQQPNVMGIIRNLTRHRLDERSSTVEKYSVIFESLLRLGWTPNKAWQLFNCLYEKARTYPYHTLAETEADQAYFDSILQGYLFDPKRLGSLWKAGSTGIVNDLLYGEDREIAAATLEAADELYEKGYGQDFIRGFLIELMLLEDVEHILWTGTMREVFQHISPHEWLDEWVPELNRIVADCTILPEASFRRKHFEEIENTIKYGGCNDIDSNKLDQRWSTTSQKARMGSEARKHNALHYHLRTVDKHLLSKKPKPHERYIEAFTHLARLGYTATQAWRLILLLEHDSIARQSSDLSKDAFTKLVADVAGNKSQEEAMERDWDYYNVLQVFIENDRSGVEHEEFLLAIQDIVKQLRSQDYGEDYLCGLLRECMRDQLCPEQIASILQEVPSVVDPQTWLSQWAPGLQDVWAGIEADKQIKDEDEQAPDSNSLPTQPGVESRKEQLVSFLAPSRPMVHPMPDLSTPTVAEFDQYFTDNRVSTRHNAAPARRKSAFKDYRVKKVDPLRYQNKLHGPRRLPNTPTKSHLPPNPRRGEGSKPKKCEACGRPFRVAKQRKASRKGHPGKHPTIAANMADAPVPRRSLRVTRKPARYA